jgi:hypothetical protein
MSRNNDLSGKERADLLAKAQLWDLLNWLEPFDDLCRPIRERAH